MNMGQLAKNNNLPFIKKGAVGKEVSFGYHGQQVFAPFYDFVENGKTITCENNYDIFTKDLKHCPVGDKYYYIYDDVGVQYAFSDTDVSCYKDETNKKIKVFLIVFAIIVALCTILLQHRGK